MQTCVLPPVPSQPAANFTLEILFEYSIAVTVALGAAGMNIHPTIIHSEMLGWVRQNSPSAQMGLNLVPNLPRRIASQLRKVDGCRTIT